MAWGTLTEMFTARSDDIQQGITFILSETEERFLSYHDLYSNALQILYVLQSYGFKHGDEIIFQLDDNYQLVSFFWACILGGLIAVPVSAGASDEHKMKLFKIWTVLKQPRLITSSDFFQRLDKFALENSLANEIKVIADNTLLIDKVSLEGNWGEIHPAEPSSVAFIQFSSGSTGDPKGVIITHQNVLINLGAVIRWVNIGSGDAGLNWMPLTHDMGLVGTHIKGLLAGINQYNMHTALFIKHPTLWLEKASQHRVTLLYSPNFGYKHLLKFLPTDMKKNWDLSNVRLIFNGAEPISIDLCNEFLQRLSPFGLRRNVMYPVYGLAEGTIAVTFPIPGEEFSAITLDRNSLKLGEPLHESKAGDPHSISFADEGFPIDHCDLRICDEKNNELGENRIGYIQIRGGNVTSGYYNNPEASKRLITPDGWLNTGDLGFLRNKRLVVTGRAKDIIFYAGQNYYAHDIERIAETVDGIELGKVAAVGVFNQESHEDNLILFVLFKQKLEKFTFLTLELKKAVSEQLGIEIAEVIPVKSIPKTTSGKIQRYKLRERFLNGEFDSMRMALRDFLRQKEAQRPIAPPHSATEKKLVEIWSEVLNIKSIGIHDHFFELGGDSLRGTQLLTRVRDHFGIEIEPETLFDHPEIAKLAAVIDGMSPGEQRRQKIGKFQTVGPVPLSFGQGRLWFLDKLGSGSPQYNLYMALSLTGDFRPEILTKSMNEVLKRHEILRTSFTEAEGAPVQTIHPEVGFPLVTINLDQFPAEERLARALQLAKEEASRPFQLAKAPLIRGLLLQLQDAEYILMLTAHHIIFDGWSFGILWNEFIHYYEMFSGSAALPLPLLPLQYSDYTQWQLQNYESIPVQEQVRYWKNQLGGELPVLNLPFDFPRPTVQTFHGARIVKAIPAALLDSLRRLAQGEGVTLYMLLLAVFKTLLHRYTGQDDLIIGTPVANRTHQETENLIGFFVNNLVLRTQIAKEMRFCDYLHQVKQVTLAALANQDVPFEKLVEELHVERSMSQNPLFQVFFSLQNELVAIDKLKGVSIQSLNLDNGYARFDLAVDLWETTSGLNAVFEYNTDLLLDDTVSRIADSYLRLLENVTRNAKACIGKLEILSDVDKRTLLIDWNNTQADFGVACLPQLFEAQVRKTPEAVAVVSGAKKLTYRNLNTQANQLAHYLIKLGVKPETVVGIYLERSVEMLVGLLAVQKAGGAYLPLDPIFPRERILSMMEDAGAPFILTQDGLVPGLPDISAKIISLDQIGEAIATESAVDPDSNLCPHDLAYQIYTSGSTGKPKGVQIEQHALTNLLHSMVRDLGLDNRDALLAVTTLSFDIAALELFAPLIVGAKVVIATREETLNGEALSAQLVNEKITVMQATPATWRLLLDSGWQGKKDLNVLCGGEALSRTLADQLLERVLNLYNVYGPTETTIWSTMSKIDSTPGPIVIGKPIANTTVYVLDSGMIPVPPGVVGELFIGGSGLARGYYQRPELTREKFIPNPFSGNPSDRLYRTGDLVRFRKNGAIEFIGRTDDQVKIRGYRIELGEIEVILQQHPVIKQSVVCAKESAAGDKFLVAYLLTEPSDVAPPINELRNYLREKLPDYMVPAAFVKMNSFPLTANGKVDRKTLPFPDQFRPDLNEEDMPLSGEIEQKITEIWKAILKVDRIGFNDNFFDLGGHSLLLAQVHHQLIKVFKTDLSIIELFKYTTVKTLAEFFRQKLGLAVRPGDNESNIKISAENEFSNKDIAIIGLSGRFPGAKNIEEFWLNICQGVESIGRFTDAEILEAGVSPDMLSNPNYVKAWGYLDGAERFDAQFFGYNPVEAEILDPQQRIFLEECWSALENAGYDPEKCKMTIGVFAGVGMNTYFKNLEESGGLANTYQNMISNDKDFLATRVSYKMNLEGPAVTIQTACSTSLVAVHLACQSLLNGECGMALAGGVSVRFPQKSGYLYQEGMILSPDGHCRAFDENARGTVGGNGAGVVVIKRLEDALAAGDFIYAVIKGSAINNDGAAKIGYTAPRVDGQAKVIAEAQAKAGIDPETIQYIEAHGTGTPLGDPIEIEALTKAFRQKTNRTGFCALGSVKTNVGHLDAAAGVTGLIKTVLALHYKLLPPSLNYQKPNPKIDFTASPFYVNTRLTEWRAGNKLLRAGVSSFGIGGTNVHLVLEEAPLKAAESSNTPGLLILSAKTEAALERITDNLANHIKKNPQISLAALCHTLQIGRKEFNHKRMLVTRSTAEAVVALETRDPRIITGNSDEMNRRKVVFMFPGQGSQYVNMGADLYREEPVFRQTVDHCAGLLKPLLGSDLREIIYPKETSFTEASQRLKETAITQPALFTIEYALAQLWLSWGVGPEAMIGHSVGEYVAACLAEVLTLEDALSLVAARGRLIQQLPGGAMLAVIVSESEIESYLEEQLSIAAVNAPAMCVVSGPTMAIEHLEHRLQSIGVLSRRLHTSHAFHSGMMDPILVPFKEIIKQGELRTPKIPYLSNVTGTWIGSVEATDPEYWVKHLRQGVRFADGIRELSNDPEYVFLEVGPGNTLATFTRQQLGKKGNKILTSLRHPQEEAPDQIFMLKSLGKLWLSGVSIDWERFGQGKKRQRIPLPTYPFEGKSYWAAQSKDPAATTDIIPRKDASAWYYIPIWKQSANAASFAQPVVEKGTVFTWLVFTAGNDFDKKLVERLRNLGQQVIVIESGTDYQQLTKDFYRINLKNPSDYRTFLKTLAISGIIPHRILTLWGLGDFEKTEKLWGSLFFNTLYLVQAVGEQAWRERIRFTMVTDCMHQIFDERTVNPQKAILPAMGKVISQEYPYIHCTCVDFSPSRNGEVSEYSLLEQLIAELWHESSDPLVAYRGKNRWVLEYEPVQLQNTQAEGIRLQNGGNYLLTGGLGGIGMVLAETIAANVKAKLIMVGRSSFPEKEQWAQWLAEHEISDPIAQKVKQLQHFEELGTEVHYFQADISNQSQVEVLTGQMREKFGTINGIIHAAGVPGGGMIQRKQKEEAERVLSPKINGAIFIHEAFKELKPDFHLFCSSINAITGGFGQLDYAAANAFLDAFAQFHDSKEGTRYISINWDRWPGIGMAVEFGPKGVRKEIVSKHPLLAKKFERLNGQVLYEVEVSPEKNWELSEHLLLDAPTIAGTTYLEMARAAWEESVQKGPVEMSDVLFLHPMVVKHNERRSVLTLLTPKEDGYDFQVVSCLVSGENERLHWQEHARGRMKPRMAVEPKHYDISALKSNCGTVVEVVPGDETSQFIRFGERWKSLRRLYDGGKEVLLELELSKKFLFDLEYYYLHPALLDVATGSIRLLRGENYLPFSYGKVTVNHRLTPRMFSYIRFINRTDRAAEILSCDIELLGEDGTQLVEVKNFSMKLVGENTAREIKERRFAPLSAADSSRLDDLFKEIHQEDSPSKYGLSAQEGRAVFERILKNSFRPQIIVSKKDIQAAITAAGDLPRTAVEASIEEAAISRVFHPRPDLKNAFVAPKNATEQQLVALWEKLLGITGIGIYDDFFELGGDSLLLVQFHAKLKEKFATDIQVVDLYTYSTIASLAKELSAEDKRVEQPSFQMVKQRATKQIEAAKQRREQMMRRGVHK